MSWWGKIFGAFFGYLLGGPFGLIVGFLLGHYFDRGLVKHGPYRSGPRATNFFQAQQTFFEATFSVMGHIAKADGRVSENEIRLARTVMTQLGLTPALKQRAMHLFNQGKQPNFNLDATLTSLLQAAQHHTNLLRMFIEIQLQAAYADGVITPIEQQILQHICQTLGFNINDYSYFHNRAQGERAYQRQARRPSARPSLRDAYRVLGVSPETSDSELKKAYRRLISQHHPDKLVAKGLPEEMMKLANQKTHEIKAAYEQVKAARGI